MSDRREDDRRRLPRPGGRRADDPPADWISIAEYADRYGVHWHTVSKWVKAGILESYRCAKVVRIRNLPPDQHSSQGA